MKKILLMFILSGFMLTSCKDKNNSDEATNLNTSAKDTLTDFDRLEGKVVMSSKGDWFVIKNGSRWVALSEPATTDYLNSIKNGQNNIVKNVDPKILEQFPYVGEILPKLEYKRDEKATK